jgi:hypothetical protein
MGNFTKRNCYIQSSLKEVTKELLEAVSLCKLNKNPSCKYLILSNLDLLNIKPPISIA